MEQDEITIYGTTADVSANGIFIRTAVPLLPGKNVDIQLDIGDSSTPIVAEGVVTRSSIEKGDRHSGIGIEFTEIKRGYKTLAAFTAF